MARRRGSRKRGSRRSSGRKRTGGYRRRRRGGGGLTSFLGRSIAKPTKDVAWYAGAMVAGELLIDAIESFTGFDVPDAIPDTAAGLFVYGWWFRDADAQRFAYALALADFIDDTEFVSEAKDTVRETIGVGDDDDEGGDEQGALPSADEELVGQVLESLTEEALT
ncbi:MAG TPA: hypothetical protein VEA38_11665 [Terriglobales bacterium]|nr:hypothetical protein [Terriglobales bacterium]